MIDMLKRILICALVCGITFFWGYDTGRNSEKLAQSNSQVKAQQTEQKKQTELQNVADASGKTVDASGIKIQYVYRTINKEVIKYVEKHPDGGAVLDVDWVSIFNASSAACDPAEPACQSLAKVSKPATAAEAIDVIKQQHELYQQCRNVVEGWQEFYVNLKEKHDASN